MRIIGGSARGIQLFAPKGEVIRPVPDAVRESLFNILQKENLEGKRVLDLFAGTGSLGLEALSRGAFSCLFVERLPAALEALARNLKASGFQARGRILATDALFIHLHPEVKGESFELIFADPPYPYLELTRVRRDLLSLLNALLRGSLLSSKGLLIVGHRFGLMNEGVPFREMLHDRRRYRKREVSFFSKIR